MLTPIHFIGEEIDVDFVKPPMLENKPGCPDSFTWQDQTFQIVELINEWNDNSRRGRDARNMQPQHAAVAAKRGSWGVGRVYFRVQVEEGRYFELYYDRALKDTDRRKGAWFIRCELADT